MDIKEGGGPSEREAPVPAPMGGGREEKSNESLGDIGGENPQKGSPLSRILIDLSRVESYHRGEGLRVERIGVDPGPWEGLAKERAHGKGKTPQERETLCKLYRITRSFETTLGKGTLGEHPLWVEARDLN